VLGQHQEAPSPLTVPMIDVSVHGGSRHGGSRHGSMRGSRQNSLSLSPRAMQAGKQQPHQEQQELAGKASQAGDRQDGVLEVKCMGTSVGSCSSSSIFAVQEGPRAVAQPADAPHQQPQPQQQQPPPREPLFASTWGLQAVPPEVAGSPPAAAASRQHHHQQ
jgi:hypothetical protein